MSANSTGWHHVESNSYMSSICYTRGRKFSWRGWERLTSLIDLRVRLFWIAIWSSRLLQNPNISQRGLSILCRIFWGPLSVFNFVFSLSLIFLIISFYPFHWYIYNFKLKSPKLYWKNILNMSSSLYIYIFWFFLSINWSKNI